MEHRRASRHAIRTSVVLHPRGVPPVFSSTVDISISGMFVTAEPKLFTPNSIIDVEVTLPAAAGLRTYRWPAMVIRKTEAGVGLMFDRVRPPAIVALIDKFQTDPDFPGKVLTAPPPI
jgi:hypothetical protein